MKRSILSLLLLAFFANTTLHSGVEISKDLSLRFDQKLVAALPLEISTTNESLASGPLDSLLPGQSLDIVFCNFTSEPIAANQLKKKYLGFAMLLEMSKADDNSMLIYPKELYYFDEHYNETPFYYRCLNRHSSDVFASRFSQKVFVFEDNLAYDAALELFQKVHALRPLCPCNLAAFTSSLYLWNKAHLKTIDFLLDSQEYVTHRKGVDGFVLTDRAVTSSSCTLKSQTLWNLERPHELSLVIEAQIAHENEKEETTVLLDCISKGPNKEQYLQEYLYNTGLISKKCDVEEERYSEDS